MQQAAAPINEELVPGSSKLYVFFGGIAGAIGMPPFEFYRISGILPYSRVFLRDTAQAWYQQGLPTIGPDMWSVGAYLRDLIDECGAREVCFVGNSMGGYAGLLFAALLRRGRVIAFSPQTFISAEQRGQCGDDRWAEQIARLHAWQPTSPAYDLRAWISERCPQLRAQVHVCPSDSLDLAHAEYLADLPGIGVRRHPSGGHGVVKALRDAGRLTEILRS